MKIYLLFFVALLFSLTSYSQTIVNVPSPSGGDDTSIIMNAINSAGSEDIVQFQAGTYKFESTSIVSYANIYISGKHNITLQGADPSINGVPRTKFIKTLSNKSDGSNHEKSALLYARDCNDFSVKNISFDNNPRHVSAGKVIQKGANFIKVELFSGVPMENNTPFIAANVWDSNKNLKKVSSLSYATSNGNVTIDNASNRYMKITINQSNIGILNSINLNEFVSWHFGGTGRAMININGGRNILLDNTDVHNSLRSGINISFSENVTIRNVDIKPLGNQLAMGPRDGIHSSRVKGDFLVENCDIEGTRLDGFVAGGTFAKVYSKTSNNRLRIETDSFLSGNFNYDISLPIEFIDENGEKNPINVVSASRLSNSSKGSIYEIVTSNSIPSFVAVGTVVIPRGLTTKSLISRNNIYKNIAGASEVLYLYNAKSTNNTHSYIMYPAIKIGSNSKRGYAGNNYEISNSSFTDCAWEYSGLHYYLQGYISIDNNSNNYGNAFVKDVTIKNNLFRSTASETNFAAIEVKDTYGLYINGNTFNGFNEPIKFDALLTRDISISNNTFDNNSIITKKINISKDAFVKGGSSANNNYGLNSWTETKYSTNSNFNRITFLNYTLPSIPANVTEASLYLNSMGTSTSNSIQNIKVASNDSWGENTITFNNKPSYSYVSGYHGFYLASSTSGWVSDNILDIVNNRPKSNSITLVIEESSSKSSLNKYYTKEGSFKGDSFLLLKYTASGFQNKSFSKDEIAISDKIKYTFYPNPISGDLAKIFVSNSEESLESYEIFNLNGSRILKNSLDRGVKNNLEQLEYNLSIGNISKGIYFIKLNTKTNSKILKFIKR